MAVKKKKKVKHHLIVNKYIIEDPGQKQKSQSKVVIEENLTKYNLQVSGQG